MKAPFFFFSSCVMVSGLYVLYSLFSLYGHRNQGTFSTLQKRDSSSSFNFRIQSWNLRNAGMPGSTTAPGTPLTESQASSLYYTDYTEEPWSLRQDELVHQVLFYNPDIFAVEEALEKQVNSIADGLSEYSWVGVGRDDNKTSGEHEAVFYKKNKFTLSSWDTFWLSYTPFKVSKFPGAGSNRVATVCRFQENSSGVKFSFINTHFDDKSDDARRYGASLIKYRAAYEYSEHQQPVFLVGDFNSKSDGSTSGAFDILTGKRQALSINSTDFARAYKSDSSDSFYFADLYATCSHRDRLGHFSTFTGFDKVEDTSEYGRIDFHMAGYVSSSGKSSSGTPTNNEGPSAGWQVVRYFVPGNFPDVKYRISDHRTVISDLVASGLPYTAPKFEMRAI